MKKLWKDKFNDLLGQMPDSAAAKIAGVSFYVAASFRRKYGIKSYKSTLPKANCMAEFSDEELMHKPLNEFTFYQRNNIAEEVRKRGLRRHKKKNIVFRVGMDNLKTTMIKAAFQMKPPPTLEEVGQVLGITRERVRQILKK